MQKLLDHIFYNLEERDLDRSQIESYIRYLDELMLHSLPLEKQVNYHNIKLKLLHRLNKLNRGPSHFFEPSKKKK